MKISRPVIITVWSLVFISLCYAGWRYIRERDLATRSSEVRYGVRLTSQENLDKASRNRQQIISQAKIIRDKWEEWANQNQDTLRNMEKCQGDPEAIKSFYASLPGVHDLINNRVSLKMSDLFLPETSTRVFVWNVTHRTKGREPNPYLMKMFNDNKDFPVAVSMGSLGYGRNQVVIWASGRVTEEIIEPRKNPRSGESASSDPVSNPVYPPFAFIEKGN